MIDSLEQFGPRVGVAIFVVGNGKCIFLKRQGSHGAGTWCTPGGHVDFGEDPLETCKREAYEETGCVIDDVEFVTMTNDYFQKEGKHYVSLWFVGRWVANEPRIMEPQKCTDLRWTGLDDMPQPRMLSYQQLTSEQWQKLRDMIARKRDGEKTAEKRKEERG